MGTEATDVRLARLEVKMDAGFARLDAKIDMLASELREAVARTNTRVDSLGARLNTVMFGIVAAVLVPILLRVFWP